MYKNYHVPFIDFLFDKKPISSTLAIFKNTHINTYIVYIFFIYFLYLSNFMVMCKQSVSFPLITNAGYDN